MSHFFTLLRKGIITLILVAVFLFASAVPNLFLSVPKAEAGAGLGNFATEATQWLNNLELGALLTTSLAEIGIETGQLALITKQDVKEFLLDTVAWGIAKRIASGMVASITDWVNSGFQGRPSFVQDLGGFLLNIADEEAAKYLVELGLVNSFFCSPFQLDIQLSLDLKYRTGNRQANSECSITGIVSNVEGFLSGNLIEGGWEGLFAITAEPQNSPLGSILTAEVGMYARLANAKNEELVSVNWGGGFIASKVCGDTAGTDQCIVTNPGAVINSQLNKALNLGQDTLVEADEWNELIGALIGQLAKTAITGAAGLLGLSGGNRFSYPGYASGSYLGDLAAEAASSTAVAQERAFTLLNNDIAVAEEMLAFIEVNPGILPMYRAYIMNIAIEEANRNRAERILNEQIIPTYERAIDLLPRLEGYRDDYEDPTTTITRKDIILNEYLELDRITKADLDAAKRGWPTYIE